MSKTDISVLVIYTGGTIGMMKNEKTGALEPFNFENLYKHIPVLERYPFNIDFYSFDPLIDSSDMNPDFWKELAKVIEQNYEAYEGFVVLHGTDTMSYTASALSFMLNNLNKPVILTGSQLPLGMLRTDGIENFTTAIEIAGDRSNNKPVIPEVCVYFENRLFRGNRTTKFSSENFNAFFSGNYPTLAEVGIDIKYNVGCIRKPNTDKLQVSYELDNNIALLKLFPGISQQAVHSILNIEGLKGVVIETFGSGNAPSAPWFIKELKSAIDSGIIIYNVSQCKAGSVDLAKYQAGLQLEEIGVISGHDITPESAITKMMHLFGTENDSDKIKSLLEKSLRGEMI
ncbi:asparaginase [Bacteroidales bacterium OttesenSCG-928-K22]|nr:asparaginase [Bacteroidales bacterium OttesenSCG-928-K22]